jgi:alginate production protein
MNADWRQSVRSEIDYDLSGNYESDYGDTEPGFRVEFNGYMGTGLQAFMQTRLRKKIAFIEDRTNLPNDDLSLQITQLFLLARDVGMPGLALQLGRQDFDEPREWLFDEYLDAARLYYYGQQPLVFEGAVIHAVSPLKEKFETWTDLFGQARWYFDKHNYFRTFVLQRWDSDESRKREPFWLGFSYYGEFFDVLKPWFQSALMRGEDKGETLKSNAIEIGATATIDTMPLSPSISVSYAGGSGDKTGGDGISNDFRQTGYEDNVGYMNGVSYVRYYGELLDPELSNLKIWTLGMGVKPHPISSLEFVFHEYSQQHPDDKLRSDLIAPPARPNGQHTDIGREIDFIFGISSLWSRITISWIYGLFMPGEAFGPYQENASVNKLSLQIAI